MTASLEGKTALVTGSSRGIGAAIAEALHRAGAKVFITYQGNRQAAEAVAAKCGNAVILQYDAGTKGAGRKLADEVLANAGQLDILVNNAGILEQKPFLDISEDEWDTMLEVNLRAPFFLTQAFARHFMERGEGRVINISSIGGQFGGPKAPHYAASKGAMLTMTKSLSRLLSPSGVTVNAIAPGFIETDMMKHMATKVDRSEMVAQVPIGRLGEPEDVAAAAVYLASADASFVTGQVINVNGGQYLG